MATVEGRDAEVVLRPPVEVMRPKTVQSLPNAPNMIFQPKDGFRALVFALEGGRIVLQSRSVLYRVTVVASARCNPYGGVGTECSMLAAAPV
jgi:hypothetical protein